jgi:two-component system, OmpR family, phosphate regulon response regulator PhoB
MPRTIVVIEDEYDFADVVALNLRRAGFDTVIVRSGEAGIAEVRRRRPDLVLLDLMLPDMQGTEICRRLKSETATRAIPIIMVTARGEEIDRVVGFELGADDYLVKPVSMRELVLRVNAVLRRSSGPAGEAEPSFEAGPLRVDGPSHRAYVEGQEVSLTALEFRLLTTLHARRGRVCTREALLDQVWGIQADVETRTVDTMMKRLRDKLGAAGRYLETVRGVGYRFSEADLP